MPLGERFPEVLAAAAGGAEWAWAEVYRDLAPGLLRFLTGQGAADPEDCLGEVFIQIVRQLGGFHGDEPAFRTWAFTIARSRLIDAWRKDQRRPAKAGEDVSVAADRLAPAPPQEPATLQRAAVEEILSTLSPDQRAVLMLRYVHQFSSEETAAIIGKPEGTVRVLQHRALRTLRRTLPGRWAGLRGAGQGACA
ncbi:MAG: RNA polymerase sigma factor [Actinobacteria bacterium]|nr:RNA polymerase sigma factor [Actinomycetota bacterium]